MNQIQSPDSTGNTNATTYTTHTVSTSNDSNTASAATTANAASAANAANTASTANDATTANAANTANTANKSEMQGQNQSKSYNGRSATLRFFLWIHGVSLAWGIPIFALVMVAVTCLINFFGSAESIQTLEFLPYGTIVLNATGVYMFVIGICTPLYLSILMPYGATRKQVYIATIASGLIVCTALFLLATVIQLLFDDPILAAQNYSVRAWEAILTPSGSIIDAATALFNWVNICISFLLGCVIALGFQLRRVLTAIAGILISIICLPLVNMAVASITVFDFQSPLAMQDSYTINLLINALLAIILTIALSKLCRLIPVKC